MLHFDPLTLLLATGVAGWFGVLLWIGGRASATAAPDLSDPRARSDSWRFLQGGLVVLAIWIAVDWLGGLAGDLLNLFVGDYLESHRPLAVAALFLVFIACNAWVIWRQLMNPYLGGRPDTVQTPPLMLGDDAL